MSSRFGSVPGGGPGCGGLGVTRRSWPLLCCALREVSAPSLTVGLLPRLPRPLPVTDAKGTIARQERTSAKQTHRLVHRTNRCGKRRARFIVRKPLSEAANRLTEPASCLLRELVEGQPLLPRTLLATLHATAARLIPVNKKTSIFSGRRLTDVGIIASGPLGTISGVLSLQQGRTNIHQSEPSVA